MQHKSLSKIIATPEGIVINGIALSKMASSLSSRQSAYINRASELLAQVKKEEWESRTPHDANHVPTLAKVNMLLALAQPVRLGKANFNPDQARDEDGRWTDEGGDAGKDDSLSKPYVNANYKVKGVVGNGECVALVKKVFGLPSTKEWIAGQAITAPGSPPLSTGTAIATFNEDGLYPQGKDTPKHAAIFVGYTEDGMTVYDQWKGQPPHTRLIYFDDTKNTQNNASNYSVILRRILT